MSRVLKTAAIVVGAVALVASGIGAAAGAGLLTTTIAGSTVAGFAGVAASTFATIGTLASAAAGALSLAAGLTAKKPTAEATGSQTSFSANPDAGAPMALGRTGTAGDIVARFGWDTRDAGDNDRQAFVAALSLGPIAAIEGQTVDRNPVPYSATGGAIGAFAGFMWSMTQLGALASPALGFGAGAGNPPGWTAQHGLSGKAAATWTLRFDTKAKMYQNGVPSPMWTVRGILAYDPRKDSTYPGGNGPHRMADPADTAAYDAAMATWEWTEDPYLLGLRWAHGLWQRDVRDPNSRYQRVMGIGAPWPAIDVAAFVEGANVAQANGWTCGGMVYSGDGKWDTMKKILQAGMGEPLALGARISCFVNAPKVSLATVTIDDVVGAASVAATQPRRDRINTITPSFRLEANAWQHLPGAPISVPEHVAEDGGKRARAQDYWLIQNTKQVGTAVRYDIENAREFGPITLPVKLHWMGYKPGDCVTAVLPELGLNGQPILLLNRTLGAASGIVTLSARSETAAKHAFALGQTATPPPTPGVSGPPLVPVPSPNAWAITATSLISQAQTAPALVVSGSVDASTADAVVIEYRPFASGQSIDAGWTSAGVWSVGASRAEITSVRSGTAYEVAISYQRNGVTGTRRIIGPVVTAGPTIDFDGVTGPNRPENGATVGAPAGTKIGDRPVEEVIAQLDQIEPITSDVSAIKEQQVGQAAELAALDDARIDMEAIQRQAERDAGKLSEATLRLLTESARTREVLRDAGIVVDPVTGVVRIYAVDQVAERTNRVEVGLDAVRGTISLKADSNWVEERIALAVLDPAQAAQLEPIIARLTKAEVEVDGLKGTIVSKADAIELTKVGGRVTTAQQDIDALKGSIALKLDKTTFDGLSATVQSLEQKLDTVGDTTSYSLNIRQARLVADDAATAALRGLLAGDDANRRQIVQAAQARQDIFTRLDGDKLTEAQARLALTAEIGAVRSMAVSETTARITAVDAVARDVRALGVTTDKQAAAIGEVNEAVIDAKGGLARNATTIRQVVGRADTADEAILRALINGDDASRARQAQIVQIQTEFSTTLNANESASAFARQALLARMNAAEAAIVDVQRVLADNIQSLVERVRASEAAWRDPETGLVATRARLALEENLSATRSQANAKAIETLSSTIYDPATGLPAAFSTIGSVRETAANANLATSKAIDQVRAVIDGVGSVGLQQAFEAVVDRLGKIEGTITWQIDVNGNVTGLKLIGGGQGPGSLNLINTDLKMGTGRVVYNTGTYMKVQGVGFGAAKDLIEWYGPTMAISQCSRANALEYRTTTGDAYYGGSLSAGTLRNGNQSSSLAADAVAEVPSFGSNGKPVRYIASWSYYRETTRSYSADNAGLQAFNQDVASYNATSDDGGFTYFGSKNVEQPSSSITLTRSFGQAYEQLQQRSFTTQQQTFAGLKPVVGAGEPGNATFTASIGGGFTVLDPTQSTANRTLRLALARGFTLPDGVIQRLSIVAIEE